MGVSFARLFEPGRIGAMEVKNRVILSPHGTRLPSKNGGITDGLTAYYRKRAGVGLVVVEGVRTWRPRHNRIWAGDDSCIPGLRQLSDAIHECGAKAAVETNISRGRADEVEPISASDVAVPETGIKPRALSIEEIEWMVEVDAEGARRARDAGFDAIMIHASHGYLISDFLSPLTNRRQDRYGGRLENRARLLLEVVHRTREKTGADYPILVRMLGSDRDGHFNIQDAVAVARMLEEAGVSLIDVTSGTRVTMEWVIPPERMPRACNLDAAEAIKQAVTIPVCVTGRIDSPYLAERILEDGKADFVGMVRALDADADFIPKAMEGRPEQIRRCIGCVRCMEGGTLPNLTPIRCSVNPFAGREAEIEIRPAEQARRVLVIGGGPAGMEAARIAALRGHHVTLWEKTDRLGGQLNIACLAPDKAIIQTLIEYLAGQMQKLGVSVELGREATPYSVLDFKADVVIVAVGAATKLPEIPGAGLNNVVTASDVLNGKVHVGQRVVVLSIDSIGCEVAEFLAERGRDVTIVDPSESVASEMLGRNSYMSRIVLVRNLKRKMVGMLTSTRPMAITQEGVSVADREGKEKVLPADTVVAAVGFTPRKELFQALEDRTRVYQIGDCAEPRRVMEAIHEGAEVGLLI